MVLVPVKSNAFGDVTRRMSDAPLLSYEMVVTVCKYCWLLLQYCWSVWLRPTFVTTVYSLMLLGLQVVCIMVSLTETHRDDVDAIYVTLVVCGLNILLVIEIATLLLPMTGKVSTRPEYMFAVVGAALIVSALVKHDISWDDIVQYLKMSK